MGCSQSKSAVFEDLTGAFPVARSSHQDEDVVLPEGPKIKTTPLDALEKENFTNGNILANSTLSDLATKEKELLETSNEEPEVHNDLVSDKVKHEGDEPTDEHEKSKPESSEVIISEESVNAKEEEEEEVATDESNGTVPSILCSTAAAAAASEDIKAEVVVDVAKIIIDPVEAPAVRAETNAKSDVKVNEGVAKPANQVDISPAWDEAAAVTENSEAQQTETRSEAERPAIIEMETLSRTLGEEAKIVVAKESETEIAYKKKKVKPSIKHNNDAPVAILPDMTTVKKVQKDELKPIMNAKSPALGVKEKTNGRRPGGGVLFIEEFDAKKVAQRKAHYGTPIDFDLPAVVADMEAREMERRQIVMKKGIPAIKINEFVRVVVISIVVEAVSSSSRSY